MRTVPTDLWPYLVASEISTVEVYEIEAFGGRSTLYYSSQDVTWGGNDYVGLAVQRTEIKEAFELVVPDCSLTFSNVTNVLRGYLYPEDTLTGARLTVRLLVRDSGGTLLTDSVILFRGVIEPPKGVTEEEFTLFAVGLLDGGGAELPARRMTISCQWQYANKGSFSGGGNCTYVSNTTTSSASGGTPTTLNLVSTTASGSGTNSFDLSVVAASGFKNGDFIKIGSAEPVTIVGGGGTTSLKLMGPRTWSNGATVVCYFANGDLLQIAGGDAVLVSSGGGTAALGLAEARTWSSGATVRHASCNRTRSNCERRGMIHNFGGFPAAGSLSRTAGGRYAVPILGQEWRALRQAGERLADPTTPVPVLYGRRRVSPAVFEITTHPGLLRSAVYATALFAWSEGPVDDNGGSLRYYSNFTFGVDRVINGEKDFGIYFREGGIGILDMETSAEYIADPASQLRAQNIDYLSLGGVAYSEFGYVTLITSLAEASPTGPITPSSLLPAFEVDGRGMLIRSYDADGSPNPPAWSNSGVWQFIDACLSTKHGRGLQESDIDFAVAKDSADYVSPLISATEAVTQVKVAQGSASTTCYVDTTEGFVEGRRVDVGSTQNTVDRIVSSTELRLGTAQTQAVDDLVVQMSSRYESHLYMDKVDKAVEWLRKLLLSFNGFVTYDSGKIQIRAERNHVTERFLNGGLDLWTDPTHPTSWAPNTTSGSGTVNQDSPLSGSSGAYSARIDRSASSGFVGLAQTFTTLEPGHWYRISFRQKQSLVDPTMAAALRVRIWNSTKNVYLTEDAITWASSAPVDVIYGTGDTAVAVYEATFLVSPDFDLGDSIEVNFCPYFEAGESVWVDDFILRGPYAGDFREFTDAKNMGWASGSFVWSLDKKDREANRVSVEFVNESAGFGTDEASSNDFDHQQTHQVKTVKYTCEAIADRDQAKRISNLKLAKLRQLGPGCQFLGSPPSLALQAGDVILVSATVPGWTCKEQRVLETQVKGRPEPDEHFVLVKTEDYDETIYSDEGQPPGVAPPSATANIIVTVDRHAGSILDLSWVIDVQLPSFAYYRIHSSDTTGFTPDPTNMIGQVATARFSYTAPSNELDVVRYYRVVAVTDFGTISSDELAITIFREDVIPPSGYSGDFRSPTAMTNPYGGYNAFSGAVLGNVTDVSDATYNEGVATSTDGIPNGDDAQIEYHSFGTGTVTGRAYVRASSSGSLTFGKHLLYYTTDNTAGTITWVPFGGSVGSSIGDFYGDEEASIDLSKFSIKILVQMTESSFGDKSITGRHYRVAFDVRS